MADWDLLLTDARIATMRRGAADYGAIEAGTIAIAGGLIDWVSAAAERPEGRAAQTRSLAGAGSRPR